MLPPYELGEQTTAPARLTGQDGDQQWWRNGSGWGRRVLVHYFTTSASD